MENEKIINISERTNLTIQLSINKDFFEKKIRAIFNKWEYTLGTGFDIYKEEEFFNEIMNIFEKK